MLLACLPLMAADFGADQRLVALAKKSPLAAEVKAEVTKRFDAKRLADGGAAISYLGDFLFAVESEPEPQLWIDEAPGPKMKRFPASNLWVATAALKTATSHGTQYQVAGKPYGARRDYSAYTEDSYPKSGIATGKMSEKLTVTSKLYEGMTAEFWIYASAGVDPAVPAPVMVWQDGQNYAREDSATRLAIATDNLVAQKKIPPMVHVMVAPGFVAGKAMRRILYDTVSDKYIRYIQEEVFPLVEPRYKLRADAYSRGIGGESSGGICSFTAAWFRTNEFSRVLSRIGSYTSIEWNGPLPDPGKRTDGGNLYPFLVRKTPKKNIRVWMSDGYEDLENNHGSWPLQNIQLANSLKMQEYDYRFEFGTSAHNTAQGNAELPVALAWLWRGYDPAKTCEEYQPDPAEKDKPYWRVRKLNRE
jgi:enterochelin esterase family protein